MHTMEDEPVPDARRYLVLGWFGFTSFMQAFAFMDFSTDSKLANEGLQMTKDVQGALLYYGAFAATIPAMWVGLWLLLREYDWTAYFGMSALTVAGAWCRLIAWDQNSFPLALLSTILLGLAGGVIFTSITFLPERWFPEKERALATALAVQSNYAGWALGCLNPLMFPSRTQSSVRTFLLWQGIITSVSLPVHFFANSRKPKNSMEVQRSMALSVARTSMMGSLVPGDSQEATHTTSITSQTKLSFGGTMTMLMGRSQYLIHSACYAIVGSVGYAVTGVVDTCFSAALPPNADGSEQSFDSNETMWLNFLFAGTGVLTGLIAGRLVPDRPRWSALTVRGFFLLGTGGLIGIQILLVLAAGGSLTKQELYPLLIVLMMVSGSGTLGFTSVGMRVAAKLSHPAEEIYSGSLIEFFLLLFACGLGLLSYVLPAKYTFYFFAIPAALMSTVVFLLADFGTRRVRADSTVA